MRVLAILACLAALLAPAFSQRLSVKPAATDELVLADDSLDLVPDNELPEVEARAAVDKVTESCLDEMGGLPKMLGVDEAVEDTRLLPWNRWFLIRCGRYWCWCRCWFWWCPWEWLHRQGLHEEARKVLDCTARGNNMVPKSNRLDVAALEKTLLEKVSKLDDSTKSTLGLDEEPVPRD